MPTAYTNGRTIGWNGEFIDGISEAGTRFVMAHEVSHIIFEHCQPWPGKDPKLCNIAMDYVINLMLRDDGFEVLEDALIDECFRGMNWQKVYAILEDCRHKDDEKQDGGQPDYNSGAASDAGLSQEKQEELGKKTNEMMENPDIMDVIENSDLTEEEKADMKQKVIQAAQAAKSSGVGNLPGAIEDLIKEIRTSKVDWKAYLRETMLSNYPDDYTMRRPNKKFMDYGLYMPTMEGYEVGTIAVGLDTSGSVSHDEMVDFLAELNEITVEFNPSRVLLMYTDWDVAKVEEYGPGEEIDTLNTRGGGGTSFVPVFDYLKKEGIVPDQLIYFSDMEVHDGCFPEEAPDYPCLFVSTRENYPVPFGECVSTKGH